MDFKVDLDKIDLRALPGIGKFKDLTLRKNASADAVVDLGSDEIVLVDVKIRALDGEDFLL